MATVEFRYDPKNTAWFTANAAMVLKAGEPAYHDTTGLFKLGDGVTALSALSFLPTVSASTPTIQQVLTAGQVATTTIETTGFIKTGGLSTQFLKADGTVDSTVYGVGNALTTNPLSQFAATTSSQLAGVISDETGSGALVFGTSPTFTTNITTPKILGGSAVGSALTLQGTSGNGTATVSAIVGNVGNNGATNAFNVYNSGNFNIGNKNNTTPRLLRIGQDTAWIDIGSQSGSTARAAIYLNTTTPDTTNFALSAHQTTGSTYINGAGGVNILFNGNIQIIYADKLSTFGSGLTNFDFNFASTNGTKLGTATTQKLSFWNATPIVQPTTAVAAATVVSGAGGTVKHDDTFDGYTVEKVVRALRNIGLLA